MRKFALSCALLLACASLAFSQTVVVLVGDSTVADYKEESTFRGWGQILAEWAAEGVAVKNHAASGASSKSFLASGRWEKALDEKPAVVFIQFGHNDRAADAARGTQPEGEYRKNLIRYIDEARGQGATPILVTPPLPRAFSLKTGELGTARLAPYAAAMREVGAAKSVPVLSLYEKSTAWFAAVGKEDAAKSAPKQGDINHYNREGAEILAGFVLEELREKSPSTAALFRDPPPGAARFPDDQRGGNAD